MDAIQQIIDSLEREYDHLIKKLVKNSNAQTAKEAMELLITISVLKARIK